MGRRADPSHPPNVSFELPAKLVRFLPPNGLTLNAVPSRNKAMKKNLILISTTAVLAACASVGSVSTQDEVQMGAQAAQQVNAQLPMVNDATIQNYVNTLGNRIARLTSRGNEL